MILGGSSSASAQTQPAAAIAPDPPAFAVRVFGEAGIDQLSASRSFNAIFGKENGPIYGGGAELVARQGWFVRANFWRFKEQGERAIRLENQTFRLGIPLTVTITPLEFSAGYRFPWGPRPLLIPYAGGGVSSHAYKETSSFSVGEENVDERFTGYQVFGGMEYRLARSFGVAGEVQYTSVPDAIGAGGLSAEFGETNLGGVLVRVRVLFGR
jgi:hypothetical protein